MHQAAPDDRRTTTAAPEAGWMPAWVTDDDAVEWIWMGEQRLSQSEYGMDVRLAGWRRPERLVTRLADLAAHAGAVPALDPAGLIFHMSRCGSTLTSRMLGAAERHVSIAEPQPLDAVIRHGDPALLRAMVQALGRMRSPQARRLFFKLDCWHVLDLPLFRSAFPDTPWVFLHREPLEVLASHSRAAGRQMIGDYFPPAFWGLEPTERTFGPDWHAEVLAAICRAAVKGLAAGGGAAVNYRDLPQAVFSRILPHFGIEPDGAERAVMADIAGLDAKAPFDTPFVRAPLQPEAGLAEACAGPLREAYEALETWA